jgi:dolichol-phosphate mannosyltransferase
MRLSIVVPVHNEAENIRPLAREISAALAALQPFEIIFVDDGSTDATLAELRAARTECPQVRILRHTQRCGQSRAVCTGVRSARADWIATLDGDGQNDPADIVALLAAQAADGDVKLVMGHRTERHDNWLRRISSRIANGVRGRILRDRAPDTGCGIKLFHRDTFLQLPEFDHMHRFLPALFQRDGAKVKFVPVRHRDRMHGRSKYGVHNRLWVGITDLFGVMWLIRRRFPANRVAEE